MKSLLLLMLRVYKLTISPYLGQRCRFYPSCSAYAELAIHRFGAITGSALAAKRLCKCHPWHAGGVDFVPEPIPVAIEDHGYKSMDFSPGRVGRRCVGPTTRPPSALPCKKSINFYPALFNGNGYIPELKSARIFHGDKRREKKSHPNPTFPE